jgi:hypothetical protein
MTQEDKELLLKCITAMFPYGVKGIITYDKSNTIFTIEGIDNNVLHLSDAEECHVEDFKPFLRPMSSMTKEEKKELERLIDEKLNRNTSQEEDEWTPWILHDTTGIRNSVGGERFYFDEMSFIYDWLNAHHFDYRGLIPMGLALECII